LQSVIGIETGLLVILYHLNSCLANVFQKGYLNCWYARTSRQLDKTG